MEREREGAGGVGGKEQGVNLQSCNNNTILYFSSLPHLRSLGESLYSKAMFLNTQIFLQDIRGRQKIHMGEVWGQTGMAHPAAELTLSFVYHFPSPVPVSEFSFWKPSA